MLNKYLFHFNRYFQIMTSGFFAGVCTTAIMAPGERIKCILQVNKKIYTQVQMED